MKRKTKITCPVKSLLTWSSVSERWNYCSHLQSIISKLNWVNCSFGFLIVFQQRVPRSWRISHSPHLLALLKHVSQRTGRQNEADFEPSDGKHSAHRHRRSLKERIGVKNEVTVVGWLFMVNRCHFDIKTWPEPASLYMTLQDRLGRDGTLLAPYYLIMTERFPSTTRFSNNTSDIGAAFRNSRPRLFESWIALSTG